MSAAELRNCAGYVESAANAIEGADRGRELARLARRAADALDAALRELKAAEPFFAIANAVTDTSDPAYREWFAEAGDHCVAFCFAGSSITLGDLRAAARAKYPERDIPAPKARVVPGNAPSGKAEAPAALQTKEA
jgi:hypothetical protein